MEHRRVFIGLRGFDYSTLLPQTLNIVPPADILEKWRQDYKEMQNSMIYGRQSLVARTHDVVQIEEAIVGIIVNRVHKNSLQFR